MDARLMAGLVVVVCLDSWACNRDDKFDFDGDGVVDAEDCEPQDETIYDGADDPYGDGIDQDCDNCPEDAPEWAGDGVDEDCDGYPADDNLDPVYAHLADCNDHDHGIFPGAPEIPNDGIDQDCNETDCEDGDGDGFCQGIGDCDDADDTIYLGAEELPDCTDNNCDGRIDEGTATADDDYDGACEGLDLGQGIQCCDGSVDTGDCDDGDPALNLWDLDGDGVTTCGPDGVAGSGDEDCDDGDDDRWPQNPETCDGKDNDCDGAPDADEVDGDGDGWMECDGDCEDSDPALNLADDDLDGYSSCDGDCDDSDPSLSPADIDQDGYSTCDGDCNDVDPEVHPAAVEVCDLIDNNCDGDTTGFDPTDLDLDGDAACSDCDDTDPLLNTLDQDGDLLTSCGGDCNDNNAAINDGATDLVGDGTDNNCDGMDGTDADGDGYASTLSGGDDCDDTDAALTPADNDGDGQSTCDGDCDDADAALTTADGDGDGFTTCDGDCDDLDPTVYPHAIEIPQDGVDQNCNGMDDCEDLNCDGWTDIVFSNNRDDTQYEVDSYIYWGSETGYSAVDRTGLPTLGGGDVHVGDLDGDGYLDIVYSNQRSNASWYTNSYIYWGSAGGYSIGDRDELPTVSPTGNSIADLDDDGYLDVFFSEFWDGANNAYLDSRIYWGSSTGFSAGVYDQLPTIGPWGNNAADVDGDGYLDIIYSHLTDYATYSLNSYIYWGSGTGFDSGIYELLPTYGAYDNSVADLDGNGYQDVVFSNLTNGLTYQIDSFIYWGDAGGLDLANPEGLPTAGATGNSIADLNYDGYLDIVFSSLYDDSSNDIPSYIYWGSSTGFFAGSRQELPTLGAVVNFIADLDTDGYLDIIFANHQQDAATFEVDSYIYWGSSTGFSEGDRDVLPALGPSGVTAAGPGIPVLRSTP